MQIWYLSNNRMFLKLYDTQSFTEDCSYKEMRHFYFHLSYKTTVDNFYFWNVRNHTSQNNKTNQQMHRISNHCDTNRFSWQLYHSFSLFNFLKSLQHSMPLNPILTSTTAILHKARLFGIKKKKTTLAPTIASFHSNYCSHDYCWYLFYTFESDHQYYNI